MKFLRALTVNLLLMCAFGGWMFASQGGSPETAAQTASADPGATTAQSAGPEDAPPSTRPEPGTSARAVNAPTDPQGISEPLKAVVKLLRAGTDEEVLLAFIETSNEPFEIGSEEIVFLTDLGASGGVIKAMMEQDQTVQSESNQIPSSAQTREPWPAPGAVEAVPAPQDTGEPPVDVPPTVAEAPADIVTVSYFYEPLAPYGTWIDVSGYGLCWQPTVGVTSPGWQPYADRGRWVYTDYGWYWYSDYSWGWAVFHYGRWFHHARWGWCWAPGTVWGPSWVSWRYADRYCGWAPLPPYRASGVYFSVGISWGIPSWCYTYVPAYQICADYPRKCAVPYDQAREVHRRSRDANHYTVGRNDTIANRGIPPARLTDNTERDIRRVAINERHEPPSGGTRRERLNTDNTTLTIFRPDRADAASTRNRPASRTEPSAAGWRAPTQRSTESRATTPAGRTMPRSPAQPGGAQAAKADRDVPENALIMRGQGAVRDRTPTRSASGTRSSDPNLTRRPQPAATMPDRVRPSTGSTVRTETPPRNRWTAPTRTSPQKPGVSVTPSAPRVSPAAPAQTPTRSGAYSRPLPRPETPSVGRGPSTPSWFPSGTQRSTRQNVSVGTPRSAPAPTVVRPGTPSSRAMTPAPTRRALQPASPSVSRPAPPSVAPATVRSSPPAAPSGAPRSAPRPASPGRSGGQPGSRSR